MESKPTYEQAQLHLQLYDLRRETRLREARDWLQANWHAETVEDAWRIAAPGTDGGRFFGMVIGYWEQACALLNYGLLHEDLFFSTSGEFFGLWEALKPVVPGIRKQMASNDFLANVEKAAKRYEEWSEKRSPGHVAVMREFMKQAQPKASSGASS